MRWLAGCFIALLASTVHAQTIDVRIHDSFGASYSSTSIGDELGAVYNIGFDPILVIILAADPGDERLREQRTIARSLAPEETGVLYAVGTPEGASSRGFTVSGNTAAELLEDSDGFRVIVLDAVGEVRVDTQSILDAEAIVAETPPG